MKCHTGVDAGSGFVHTVEATAANVHDVTVAEKLLREDDEVVYRDSAYLGLEKRDEIKHYIAAFLLPPIPFFLEHTKFIPHRKLLIIGRMQY